MSINEYMNLIVTAFYAVAFLIFLTVLPYMYLRKRRNIKVLESQIKSKIENGITLDPKLLNDFGKALGLGHFSSREPVYKLLLECNEVERFNEINDLLQKIKKEEPFDDMPDEVKPSLIRITSNVNLLIVSSGVFNHCNNLRNLCDTGLPGCQLALYPQLKQ